MTRSRLTTGVLVAALAVAAAAPAGAAVDRQQATTVRLSLMEWMVMAKPTKVKAGTVMLSIKNAGKLKHNVVVIRTKGIGMLPMKGSAAVETGRVAKTPLIAPGKSTMLMLKLKKGTYALICNVSGHYMAGMRRILRVS